MRNLHLLDQYRLRAPVVLRLYGSYGDHQCGCFVIPSPIDGQDLAVIASVGDQWEHVSVSRTNRCPNWPEMEHVKRLFFHDSDCCMQLHPPIDDYVDGFNLGCRYCLHIWKPMAALPQIPRPPKWMVGGMSMKDAENEQRRAAGGGEDNRAERQPQRAGD